MTTIKNVKAEIINDSRNVPTLSVSVTTDSGFTGVCMVPSGASTGKYEAFELRDDGTSKGSVTKAQVIVNTKINEALIGFDIYKQREIDDLLIKLDGTDNKTNLGGNSLLGVSVACAKAAAKALDKEFYEYLQTLREVSSNITCPKLYFNLINGGKHANTSLAFQEYHLVPQVESVVESLEIAQKVQDALGALILEKYGEVARGDEGGYAIPTENIREPLEILSQAVEVCGVSDKVMFALDVAASSFHNDSNQLYKIGNEEHTKEELKDTYISLSGDFPLISIEDPFHEEDFESFAELQAVLPSVVIVGDDLTVTNVKRVEKAISMASITGMIIKPNQIGTLSETIDTITFAQKNGIKCIVSHRSGETMDDMIADITVAFKTFGIKSGARGPEVREVKYRRLSAIQK
ncbi:MAG: phosphopyruvate hydratase [Candidatus Nomurabacteria bacterium]|nr:phosphopyruvate hydratase [Candidatus Nomurabacteria bacterium]